MAAVRTLLGWFRILFERMVLYGRQDLSLPHKDLHSGAGTSFAGVYRATLFGFMAEEDGPGWKLQQREQSSILRHVPWSPQHCECVKEACTGVGALGFDLSRVGISVIARNELQPVTAAVLKEQKATPVVIGNICEPKVVLALACADCKPAGLSAGISCQPYSALGDMRQGNDTRATSLPGVLRAGSPSVLLCLVGARCPCS